VTLLNYNFLSKIVNKLEILSEDVLDEQMLGIMLLVGVKHDSVDLKKSQQAKYRNLVKYSLMVSS